LNYVRPSIPEDVPFISCRLRKPDQNELELFGIPPEKALQDGLVHSLQPLTVIAQGSPAAMFGVVPGEDRGTIWLLGTDDIVSIKTPFLKQSDMWLSHVMRPFKVVGNWVDSRNTVHRKWLSWLGFENISTVSIKGTDVYYYTKTN
jgi:hypothetical protein